VEDSDAGENRRGVEDRDPARTREGPPWGWRCGYIRVVPAIRVTGSNSTVGDDEAQQSTALFSGSRNYSDGACTSGGQDVLEGDGVILLVQRSWWCR